MFGNLGNFTNLLKSAKDLQQNVAKLREELAARRFEASAGGDMVKATVDGRGTLMDIKIEPSALCDCELLEDMIKAAIGAAMSKSSESMKQDMAALTGGISLPGLTDFFAGG
ncbi:MAG: YbaB/EbfC family nucleoid-associated protein [Planctomycetes bacterium]|nr:YbaB/EbfC family nucleoid-associated protein [Planctomycetota bacterium]